MFKTKARWMWSYFRQIHSEMKVQCIHPAGEDKQLICGVVTSYWKAVFAELPFLSFVAISVLGKCSASEAAAERLFKIK
jgi:hypothetical protein